MNDGLHVPVLCNEVIDLLHPSPTDIVLDGTVGTGGHAEALLQTMGKSGRLIGLDLDTQSLERARVRLAPFGDRVVLVQASYADAETIVAQNHAFSPVNAILLDLGFSAIELEESGRGFSYRRPEEPLDMRFMPGAACPTAAQIVATASERELTKIIRDYGEEPLASRIAHVLVKHRQQHPIVRVRDLVDAVLAAYGRRGYHTRSRAHPATRTFQALRIAVNNELETLRAALPKLCTILAPGGRIAVISFHSLEDRIVKEFFRQESRACICPPELPECRCTHTPQLTIRTKHIVTPSTDEQQQNPRSRSAKLRAAEKKTIP